MVVYNSQVAQQANVQKAIKAGKPVAVKSKHGDMMTVKTRSGIRDDAGSSSFTNNRVKFSGKTRVREGTTPGGRQYKATRSAGASRVDIKNPNTFSQGNSPNEIQEYDSTKKFRKTSVKTPTGKVSVKTKMSTKKPSWDTFGFGSHTNRTVSKPLQLKKPFQHSQNNRLFRKAM